MGSNRLLTVPEAAARLNVTERWVRRAIFEKRFAVVRLGRLVRVPAEALDAYVDANAVPAARSGGVVPLARRLAR
ncbi:MAG: helix-turn-helix domain-containing protein [Actinomycetota bacterium]|nr:helix-turn-helix domain-containing protein [Actinomycetota bacterium]